MRFLFNPQKEKETLLTMMSETTLTGVIICPDFAKVSEVCTQKTCMAVSGLKRKKFQ